MEPGELAYSASRDGRAEHYIDTGASSHFIEEMASLYDDVPFEVPRSITTAEDSTIKAFDSGDAQIRHIYIGQGDEGRAP